MIRKLLDHWMTYVVLALVMIAAGVHSYIQLAAYEHGERIVFSGRLFWLYQHFGKGAMVGLSLAMAGLFA